MSSLEPDQTSIIERTEISIMEKLRERAKVQVIMDSDRKLSTDVISISQMKMDTLCRLYSVLHAFAQKSWSSLPAPPAEGYGVVFVWLLACDEYDVNHHTIDWPGSTAATYVQLWQMVDRLRSRLAMVNTDWLIGARDSEGYTIAMGLQEPADIYMYTRDLVSPPAVREMCKQSSAGKSMVMTGSHSSYMEFKECLEWNPWEGMRMISSIQDVLNVMQHTSQPA